MPTAVGAQSTPPSQGVPRIAAQVAIGALLTPVAFLGAGYLVERIGTGNEARQSKIAFTAAYTATVLAASTGPLLLGREGKPLAALGGSVAGLGAAVLSLKLGNWLWDDDRRACRIACWTLGAVTVALPSIGATLAYAVSRR